MTGKKNNWISGQGLDQINFYLNSNDVILVERYRTLKLLLDIFHFRFENKKDLHLLDIGCGDGFITRKIADIYPENRFHLLDGSDVMLEKAKENLKGLQAEFIRSTFENYLEKPLEEVKYDFIYSSMAIHHLDFLEKSKLYSRVYHELKFGGLFLNIDCVHPTSERSEEWQFQIWRDWMNETLKNNGMESDIGKHDNLPEVYKYKPENKPSGLFEQLEILRQCGFRDVDCFYKYGIFALFGGSK